MCVCVSADPAEAASLTIRANLVAVVSNGTAVLGLGNIGPLASKPVMEGKAVLFKKFAGIDVFDIEIAADTVERVVETVAALEPTFGGTSAVVVFVTIVLRSVNQIFAPTISDLHARHEIDLLGRMYQTLTKWVIGLTLPLGATMIVFAKPLMGIFGREFEIGWSVLIIGVVSQLINCAVGSSGTMLFMSGNQESLVRIQVVTAAVMILLNLVLVPHWGILGAAVAAAVTVVLTNLAYLFRVWSKLGLFPYNRGHVRLALPVVGSLVPCAGLTTFWGCDSP